ncbi:MAG: YidC/Oxa1 family insertase periplasmic-domain containing protein [Gemmataceae bacterium]
MQQRNLLLFFVLAALLSITYYQLRIRNLPAQEAPETTKAEAKKQEREKEFKAFELPPLPPATADNKLLTLGGGADSNFDLEVVLDPLGGGVRAVTLNKFRAADADGRPAGPGETLRLVPAEANEREPSNLLLHFSPRDADTYDARPFDTLGKRAWAVVEKGGQKVVTDEVDGRRRQQVSFRTEVEGVTVTKTFTLVEGEYHVGLQVDLERAKGSGKDGEAVKFRYQLTGAKGLPVEGKWYTSIFRNALIALEDKDGYVFREFEDLRQIDLWGGGNPVMKDETKFLRYAGVAVQYFASMIVVDNEQPNQKFLRRATSSLETGVARGKVKPGTLDQTDRVVLMSDDRKAFTTVYLPKDPELRARRAMLKEEQLVAVVYHTRSFDPKLEECPKVAVEINTGLEGQATHPMWEDDITVRVSTDPVALKPGDKVSHRYLLYNGPVKPSLLRGLGGDRAVKEQVIERYVEALKLNTMTDYHSPGAAGRFFNSIYWTPLVIKCTNVMHWVLGLLNSILPSYGLSIIVLTLMVRGMMFPLSRKQAMMSLKMQSLQPEMKKLADRYKDDPQGKAQAQMELFRKHGVNPVGSCWVILLQMPIFMGLYFALQESIQFRLASFWPTWIVNLAAPDMLFHWGRGIWFLSRDADYGGIFYLGPYLNLLPLFAVSLMVVQQQMLMPPPADKEQEMQQKMMRIMMIVMGLFFYKIAAGLCIYIITSTLWGFAERKLLPKAKPVGIDPDLDKRFAAMARPPQGPANGAPSPIQPEGKKLGRNKRKGSERVKAKDDAEPRGILQRFNDWWQDVLEQAKKK